MPAVRRKTFAIVEEVLTGNAVIDRAFRRLREVINPLLQDPMSNTAILADKDLIVGTNKLAHGLGRKPRGFLAMSSTAGGTGNIYSVQASNPNPEKTIWVGVQTANCTATLVVY